MKKICNECAHFISEACVKNKKNGYNNCSSYRAIPIEKLIKEYKLLLVSKENPDRLLFLKKKLENINGGTI